jgi:hypothetical protein|tara:strand:- start:722 stop:2029 length:1308 start_codon:yes stop_codon:yes gene_type:complete
MANLGWNGTQFITEDIIDTSGNSWLSSTDLATDSSKLQLVQDQSINDSNDNKLIEFTATGSAVNNIKIVNQATGSSPSIDLNGSDSNIGLDITLKGTGTFDLLNSEDGAMGAILKLYQDSASPAMSDVTGFVQFEGNNASSARKGYAGIGGGVFDSTAGAEAGLLVFVGADGTGSAISSSVGVMGLMFRDSTDATLSLGSFGGGDHGTLSAEGNLILQSDSSTGGVKVYKGFGDKSPNYVTSGAISLQSWSDKLDPGAAGTAFTLADGFDGQVKKFTTHQSDTSYTAVITPANFRDGTSFTMGDNSSADLQFTNSKWNLIGYHNKVSIDAIAIQRKGKGSDIASANDVTLSATHRYWDITGTTQVNRIASAGWEAGAEGYLQFDGVVTVKDNQAAGGGFATILITGSQDYTSAAGSILKIIYDGTSFKAYGVFAE